MGLEVVADEVGVDVDVEGAGARNLSPDRLYEQHGIAINGQFDSAARRGVQPVSWSEWLLMRKVCKGKMPLWTVTPPNSPSNS